MQIRLTGIDASRGVAILGMLVLHSLPAARIDGIPLLEMPTSNLKPQILFALLDGVALALIAARPRNANRKDLNREIVIRATFLFALGSFLSNLGTGIQVILDSYAIYFIIAIPFLRQRVRYSVPISAGIVLLIFGPLAESLSLIGLENLGYLPPIVSLPAGYLLIGPYPAITYMAYVLIGLGITRMYLHNPPKIDPVLALTTAFLGYLGARVITLTEVPQVLSQTLNNTGSLLFSITLVGTLILLFDRTENNFGKHAAAPLIEIGKAPVTIYTMHVITASVWVAFVGIEHAQSALFLCVQFAFAISFGVVLKVAGSRGPLERLMTWTSRNEALSSTRSEEIEHGK